MPFRLHSMVNDFCHLRAKDMQPWQKLATIGCPFSEFKRNCVYMTFEISLKKKSYPTQLLSFSNDTGNKHRADTEKKFGKLCLCLQWQHSVRTYAVVAILMFISVSSLAKWVEVKLCTLRVDTSENYKKNPGILYPNAVFKGDLETLFVISSVEPRSFDKVAEECIGQNLGRLRILTSNDRR